MQERNVVLTWEAIYDVTDIADYIEQEFGRERADRFERDIRQPFPPSIIFYVVKEPENEIHILRVLREEWDWGRILKE